MSDEMPREDAPPKAPEFQSEDGDVSADYLAAVSAAVVAGNAAVVVELAGDLHSSDAARLIWALPEDLRAPLIRLLGRQFDFAALTELDEAVRLQLIDELPREEVAQGIAELDIDDAVYILEDLAEDERAEILSQIPPVDRAALTRALDYPEESAGRRMNSDFIAVPPFWTVGQAIDYMREASDLPEDFHEVFIVNPAYKVLGIVGLDRLLRSKRPTLMSAIMDPPDQVVHATEDQEEVARRFERYNLVTAPVLDDAERLVGVLTIDDMVDVIEQEAEEDIRLMVGVRDEELSDSVLTSARSRLPWLGINTVTAFIAAAVIGIFEGTIAEMVALAVLMPIVAALGGNTGTQAMTVTVRAIATRELGRRNTRRIIGREVLVGFFNGIAIALLVGVGAALWFANPEIGVVIGVALAFNMLVAGLAGVLIPLGLNRAGFDPAVASGVFVTTVTDVVGFFAFLGLAAWWFGLF